MRVHAVLGALLWMVAGAEAALSQEFQVGGRTADQEFDNQLAAQLARAACEGDVGGVDLSMSAGVNPNYEGRSGGTPLHWAVKCANPTGIEALLRARADPNNRGSLPFSPTYQAAANNEPEVLALLLRFGGDPNAYYGDNPTRDTLWKALNLGMDGAGWDIWSLLLDAGADPERHDGIGNTIAIVAAGLKQFDRVADLLERGYDYDLPRLANIVHQADVGPPTRPEVVACRERVLRMLEARGTSPTR